MMTRCQALYLYHWANTGFDPSRRRECMRVAGYSESTPVSVVENSAHLRNRIEKAMERHNLTPDRVCKKLDEKLECTDENGNPDNPSQLRALDMTMKVGNFYPAAKVDINKTEQSVRLDITTVRLAEELTGDKILDAELLPEEPERASLGSGPDDSL